MARTPQWSFRSALVWLGLALAIAVPITLAAISPLLAWRQPIYILAGLAGVIALGLLLVQPMVIGGVLPGLSPLQRRRLHRWVGASLVVAVGLHVVGLWITSPPDVIDALLFNSPTPFSVWGVIAMWLVFATALLAALRRRLHISPRSWRRIHTALAVVIVGSTVAHSVLIEGTMETVSKIVLCGLALGATVKAIIDLKIWGRGRGRSSVTR